MFKEESDIQLEIKQSKLNNVYLSQKNNTENWKSNSWNKVEIKTIVDGLGKLYNEKKIP